jgi:hypothetical protein
MNRPIAKRSAGGAWLSRRSRSARAAAVSAARLHAFSRARRSAPPSPCRRGARPRVWRRDDSDHRATQRAAWQTGAPEVPQMIGVHPFGIRCAEMP